MTMRSLFVGGLAAASAVLAVATLFPGGSVPDAGPSIDGLSLSEPRQPGEPGMAGVRPPARTAASPGAAVSRPLFWPDRRGEDASEAKSAPTGFRDETRTASGWRLAGSLTGPSGVHRALIVSPDDPVGVWIEVGASYKGWKLTSVEAHHASVEAGGRRLKLGMFDAEPEPARAPTRQTR